MLIGRCDVCGKIRFLNKDRICKTCLEVESRYSNPVQEDNSLLTTVVLASVLNESHDQPLWKEDWRESNVEDHEIFEGGSSGGGGASGSFDSDSSSDSSYSDSSSDSCSSDCSSSD